MISKMTLLPLPQDSRRDNVARYEIFQKNKSMALTPTWLLQSLLMSYKIWDDLTRDFIEVLPKLEGYDSILVVVDNLSNYGQFMA